MFRDWLNAWQTAHRAGASASSGVGLGAVSTGGMERCPATLAGRADSLWRTAGERDRVSSQSPARTRL